MVYIILQLLGFSLLTVKKGKNWKPVEIISDIALIVEKVNLFQS